jgi:hypothetical protein
MGLSRYLNTIKYMPREYECSSYVFMAAQNAWSRRTQLLLLLATPENASGIFVHIFVSFFLPIYFVFFFNIAFFTAVYACAGCGHILCFLR